MDMLSKYDFNLSGCFVIETNLCGCNHCCMNWNASTLQQKKQTKTTTAWRSNGDWGSEDTRANNWGWVWEAAAPDGQKWRPARLREPSCTTWRCSSCLLQSGSVSRHQCQAAFWSLRRYHVIIQTCRLVRVKLSRNVRTNVVADCFFFWSILTSTTVHSVC